MILTIVLGVLVAVLLALAVSRLTSLVKGSSALRRAPRGASTDFDSVMLKSAMVPGVSVVCVAADASPLWRSHIRRLLDLHVGAHEVVLVVNGVAGWSEELRLEREERTPLPPVPGASVRGYYVSRDPIQLLVLDVEAPDVGIAFQTGLAAAKHSVIGLLDREAEFIPEVLLRLMRPMLQEERMLAVCGLAPDSPQTGAIRPGFLGKCTTLHTLRSWLEYCWQFGTSGSVALLPGACLLVKRDAIQSVKGFGPHSRELLIQLPAQPQVGFVPMAVSWRRSPADWTESRQQLARDRWYSAAIFPALVEAAAYLVTVAGLLTGAIGWPVAGIVVLATAGSGMLISMATVVLRELAEPSGMAPSELAALFFCAIPENLGYRQFRNLWLCAGSLRRQ